MHLLARVKPDARTRWTIDVFHKEGRESAGDEIKVRGTGFSVTYDYDRYFLRIANDPHVNFTPNRMLRFSAGIRFLTPSAAGQLFLVIQRPMPYVSAANTTIVAPMTQ